MAVPRNFRELIVWQKAIELVKAIYALTSRMPKSERFGLTNQIRRAAVSILSNIAEGNARQGRKDYLRFLGMARGSLAELETQLIVAQELNMLPKDEQIWSNIAETWRLVQGLINRLRENQP
jgi:four helix bundle protein